MPWQFIKLLFYERFNLHRKHCRMKKLHLLNLIFFILIFKTNAQSIIKQTGSNQQTNSLNTKSLTIKNAYTVYPQVESLIDKNAQIPCNISHPGDDTLLMILVYYNPNNSNKSPSNKPNPIGLTRGEPVFTLDLRDRQHSQYINHYLHSIKNQDKFKHQKRSLSVDIQSSNLLSTFNQTYSSTNQTNSSFNQFLNNQLNFIHKHKRDLDDKKANELLTNAQFISSSYVDRLSFNFSSNREQFILNLNKLKENDAGEYVCRADFKWTRTLISVVNLFVIVPSQHLYIENEQGKRLSNKIQYKEGDSLILNCIAIEGKPLSKVYWYLDHELIDDSYNQDNHTGQTLNQLIINDLRRKYDLSTLTCRAVNHLDLPPLVTTLSIQLYLKPRQVAIISNRTPLRTGKRKEIQCETTGSRPPADLYWMLGKEKLTDFKNNVSPDNTRTISTLNLIVNANHDESILYCIAENSIFRNSSIIDLWQLEVHYRPKPTLSVIDKPQIKNQLNILAGQSISLQCNVQSNPFIYEIHWLFNGRMIDHEFSIETNGNTSILTINRLEKSHTGKNNHIIECMAKNTEGIGRSSQFNLVVNYEPICIREEIIEANIGDSININCSVDASPSNCSYMWNIPDLNLLRHHKNEQTKLNLFNESTLIYKINEQLDFGSIKCQATNEFGKITCEHFVLPKAKIAPIPKDCELNHTTFNSYIIHCGVPDFPLEILTLQTSNTERKLKQLLAKQSAIYRETLQQTQYFLKVYEEDRNTVLYTSNAHDLPLFQLKEHQLHQNSTYLFVIYSKNQYEQSPDVILTTQTTQRMLRSKINIVHHQMPTLNYQIGDNLVPTLTMVAFIVICLTLTLKLLFCLTKNFKNSRHTSNNIKINDLDENINSTELMLASLNHSDHIKEIEIPEDAIAGKYRINPMINPDVIPLSVDTLDNTYINYNKPLVDCFKKSNLVTFASNHKVELICSDEDPINITLKNPYETTTYAYNENGNFTLSTTV